MANVIKWGMVGTGNVTEVKSGPGFYKSEHSVLYGVTNRTYEKAVDWAKRHNVPQVYRDLDEMIKDKKVDAIYIATPPSSHKEYALKCAKARLPCYIEKPVTLNLKDHLEILEAFKKADTPVFAAYYRRAQDRFLKVKSLIANGELGEIRFVHLSLFREKRDEGWRVLQDISGGGLFMDVGVHMIDIIIYLLGEIIEVKSFKDNQGGFYEPEDIITAAFLFKNGILGTGNWCFTTGTQEDEIKIVGEKGTLRFACFADTPIRLQKRDNTEVLYDIPKPKHVHQPMIQTIVNQLIGKGVSPGLLETSTNTAWVCEALYTAEAEIPKT